MQTQAKPIHSKLRLSGAFIILGLIVQALSLLWNHPLSFIAFVTIGGLLLVVGIVLYLLTLVNMQPAIPEEKAATASPTSQNQE
jgi:predicted membrane channel-forming protein YqfA (hemolysin III family)